MEGGRGGYYRAGCGDRPRVTLLDQMSAVADGRHLSGLTLDDILTAEKLAVQSSPSSHAPPPLPAGRTLLDIIRDEDPKSGSCKGFVANKDKKSWKSFKDRLKLKRSGSGAAWTSSVHTPTSDILIPNSRSQVSRHNSVRNITETAHDMTHLDDVSFDNNNAGGGRSIRPQISRRSSTRFGANNASFRPDDGAPNDDDGPAAAAASLSHAPSLRHQMSRRHSTRYSPATMEDTNSTVTDPTEQPPAREGSRRLSVVLAEERSLSAREAVAAQEAAEAEAGAAAAADEEEATPAPDGGAAPETESGQPVRMSLMDLLEETDRQMGFVGSRYMIGDDDDDEEFEEEEEEEEGSGGAGGVEQNCCVCMVRHKGAAFIPCGHTFCRLCSRELWVSRGNCPLCNGFILEILDIF